MNFTDDGRNRQISIGKGNAATTKQSGRSVCRELTYAYGTSGGINDRASRVHSFLDDDTTSLAAYDYLGLSAVVQQTSAQPGLVSTLISPTNSNDPNTGDIYSGLDRFGRVKDVRWRKSSTDLSRIEYGYNRVSNRTWRRNPSDTNHHHDWLYTYDGLHRLKDGERGTLNGGQTAITAPQFAQCWTLDETGNWSGFRQGPSGSAWNLVQQRTANDVNEITGISNTTGASWAQPAYDPAGNMTTLPQPAAPGSSYTATYDAWNRLVRLQAGGQTVQENAYDARGYRTVRQDYTSGSLSGTRHFYYSDNWQVLEERLDNSSTPDRQFMWGVRYIDDLILRDRTVSSTLDERPYALQDANWNVTAVTDDVGSVQERYEYDPYGQASVLTPGFGARGTSSFAWETTYCGYRWEAGSGLFAVRHRFYQARLGGWVSRDPLGDRRAGGNLYRYVRSRPLILLDGFGLQDYLGSGYFGSQSIRGQQPSLRELLQQATPDVRRAVEACDGDPNCLRALGDVFQQIASTPKQGFYNQTPNKCFRWVDDFLKNYPDYDPVKDPKITLGGGSLILEPLDLATRGGQSLVTSRGVLGNVKGTMLGHGIVRATFTPAGGTPSTGYFDLGSSTHLGDYGGADHWFWPYTPGLGFEVEMDIENPAPYTPTRTPPRPTLSYPATPSPICSPRSPSGIDVIPIGGDPSKLPPPTRSRVFE